MKKGNIFLSSQSVASMETAIEQLGASLIALKNVANNIMPEVLILEGLKPAIEILIKNINISGKLTAHLQIDNADEYLSTETQIILYRIVQELLDNVMEHAKANEVWIELSRQTDRFTLIVIDNGKGIDLSQLNIKGEGLAVVKAYATYLKGSIEIHNPSVKGCKVIVEGKCS